MTYAGLEPEVAEDELDLVDDIEDEDEDIAGEDDESPDAEEA